MQHAEAPDIALAGSITISGLIPSVLPQRCCLVSWDLSGDDTPARKLPLLLLLHSCLVVHH